MINFLRVTRPQRAAQLSDCQGAGTGCGWCRPFLEKLFQEYQQQGVPENVELPERRRLRGSTGRLPDAGRDAACDVGVSPSPVSAVGTNRSRRTRREPDRKTKNQASLLSGAGECSIMGTADGGFWPHVWFPVSLGLSGLSMARKIVNRKELRAEAEAAEKAGATKKTRRPPRRRRPRPAPVARRPSPTCG